MSESRGDIIGDKNSLAQKHMGLVHSCCKHFTGKGVEYEELFSAGCLGLAKAVERFDESRGLNSLPMPYRLYWEKSSVYFVTEVLYGLVALLRNFQ